MRQPTPCRSCGAPLARDSSAPLCALCAHQARGVLSCAPAVPPEFWVEDEMAAALTAQHMGMICRAYRTHPFHGPLHGRGGIPQTTVARWVGMTQAQVSRIENGPPIRNLDALVFWATTLRIPRAHLWFDLPAATAGCGSCRCRPTSHRRNPTGRSLASQQAWRQVRRYLNGHRSELAKAASLLYQPDVRVGPTALLSSPNWLPDQPIDLGAVELSLVDGPQPAIVERY